MAKIYLHTGSNIGDRAHNLSEANMAIERSIGSISCLSNIYETAAWGLKDQDDFLNQALEVITDLKPGEVLKAIQKIENQMGRVRFKKWGRRLIDIDILFFENSIINTSNLTIPHPFLQKRNFVLAPLTELIPNFIHPVIGKPISQIFKESQDKLKAEIYIPDKKSEDLPFKEI